MSITDIQQALHALGYDVLPDGVWGTKSKAALTQFQKKHNLVADGIAGPRTIATLKGVKPSWALTQHAIMSAAKHLNVPVACIHAIAEVESRGAGFIQDGMPSILFERHVFYKRLSINNLDPIPVSQHYPAIASAAPGGYLGGRKEHERLATAKRVHPQSAIEAASWGRFQIMGYHWKALGYASASSFENAMCSSEAHHLEAFTAFIKIDRTLHSALKQRHWEEFARFYNGPNYKKNHYDTKLAAAYKRFSEVNP